ncbi:MAG TPA: tetratricopeptide repeat protein [Rhizomicrobium sp.]
MTDIFREVEEDVRREQYEKLWKKYRDHVIAGVAIVIIGVAGYRLYQVYEQREAEKASVAYQAAAQLLESGQPRAAEPQFAALAKSAPSGYAKLSQLAQADALFASNQHNAAIRLYEQIANQSDPYFAAVARMHAAWTIVDGAPKAEVQSLLAPLTDPNNSWHDLAQEILAYADLRAGDTAAALKSYQLLKDDPKAPSSLHTRASAMVRFLNGGGAITYGHVPQPPKPAQTILPKQSSSAQPAPAQANPPQAAAKPVSTNSKGPQPR